MSAAPLPPKPAFDPAKPAAYFVRAAQIFNAWRALGVEDPFAVAMLAMADMEAAFRTDVVGDKGTAYGIYQEHTDRAARIKAQTGIDLLAKPAPALAEECRAAWWEMNTTETKARDLIADAADAANAARAATTYFERAGAGNAAERRAQDAEWWATWIARHRAWVEAQS